MKRFHSAAKPPAVVVVIYTDRQISMSAGGPAIAVIIAVGLGVFTGRNVSCEICPADLPHHQIAIHTFQPAFEQQQKKHKETTRIQAMYAIRFFVNETGSLSLTTAILHSLREKEAAAAAAVQLAEHERMAQEAARAEATSGSRITPGYLDKFSLWSQKQPEKHTSDGTTTNNAHLPGSATSTTGLVGDYKSK